MIRRLLAFALVVLAACLGLFGVATAADAQQSAKIPRLGYLSPGDIPSYDNAFLQGLEDQGYIVPGEIPHYDAASWRGLVERGSFEGQKIRIEIRATNGHFERALELATDLVRLDVDLIFAVPEPLTKATQEAVQRANKPIPIVFGSVRDPVGDGLVSSFARPGGNATGLANSDPEFDAKRLEILKETFPRLSRVAYLMDPVWHPGYYLRAKPAVEAAARTLGLRLETIEVRTPEDLEGAFKKLVGRRAEAILVAVNSLFIPQRRRIVAFAARRRLPAMYGEALFVEAGGLMFYGAPVVDQNRQSAAIVAKILKGAKPADIPVEQPMRFKLIINLKTAKALGITIPESILLRADEAIR
jgi:putative tryptophan/tyrosine transport system substrate-binding protein